MFRSLFCLLLLALAAPAGAEEPKAAPPSDAELSAQVTRGVTGTIVRVSPEQIMVRNLGEGSGGTSVVALEGGSDVKVAGLRTSWESLAQGDLVAVSYRGEPARAVGIQVLPVGGQLQAATGQDPFLHKGGREFMGWIKLVDANTLIVRTPDGPPGSNRKGDVKTFVRTPDTKVDLLRGAWSELKKGDRVSVSFSKGEPRPANKVTVVLRGGEKPLPRGLATRLYDERWDVTVKDVDGIGEWPVGEPWPPQAKGKPADPKPAPAN
jgi:hypothetical protein